MRILAVVAALIAHANVTNVPAAADLAAQVRNARTAWVAYSVPSIDGYRVYCNGRCRLDDENMTFSNGDDDDIHPAAGNVGVFYRVENGAITNIRVFSIDCPLEGSGTTVTWIDNVAPRNSVALLASLAGRGEKKTSHRAMSALAMHADPSAGQHLEDWARSSTADDELRGQAIFWLAQTHPDRGLEAARAILRESGASRKLKDKAVFALSQIKTPAASDELIRTARNDADSRVRGQAIFWLSQQAGRKAAGAIRDALDNDEDSSVREKAVFAISQLPGDQSIPMLIDLMKNHRDPNVRRKAAFWLGQKNDPRALSALEEILKR